MGRLGGDAVITSCDMTLLAPTVTTTVTASVSDSLPSGKRIILDLQDPKVLEEVKKHPITIKEGIEYK